MKMGNAIWRCVVYLLCIVGALLIVAAPAIKACMSPAPSTYASLHQATEIPPMRGFAEDSVFNVGSAKELQLFPGIGEVISQRIVDNRELIGYYRIPEDLLLVKGIGEKTLDKILAALEEPLSPLTE